ncbi:MAG: hypothetical protein RIT04_460 [Candidatus Parcubacteria bacterium]|jgi:O-6-methylguanine DNA methyltransferase
MKGQNSGVTKNKVYFRSASARQNSAIAKIRTAGFSGRVYAVVRKIQSGTTMTYREVAQRAGSPKAFRAVGNILNKNFDPNIPCHRVIRSDGVIGGYNRGSSKKIRRLRKEGALR